jgi:hypothetical protein
MKSSRLFWGLLIVLIGIILIGINFGYLTFDNWSSLWTLWPVIFVLIGISLIFGDESPVTLILTLLILLGVAAYVFDFRSTQSRFLDEKNISASQDLSAEIISGAKRAEINFNIGAASAMISGKSIGNLLSGSFSNGYPIEIKKELAGELEKITVTENVGRHFYAPRIRKERDLVVDINELIPVSININSGANKLELDGTNILLESLTFNTGASKNTVKIGKGIDEVKIEISSGASKFDLALPKEFAIVITSKSGLSSLDYSSISMTKDGDTYKTADFETNPKKVLVTISSGVSDFNLSQY